MLIARAMIMLFIPRGKGTPYLAECGVLSAVYSLRVIPQPPTSKRDWLHTFFCRIINRFGAVRYGNL